MRFSINCQGDPDNIREVVAEVLEEFGFPKDLVIVRWGPARVEYTETPNRQQLSLIINPEPDDEFAGDEVFRCVLWTFDASIDPGVIPTVSVTAYSRTPEYDHIVSGLEETLRVMFPIVIVNDVGTDSAAIHNVPVIDEPAQIAESSTDRVNAAALVVEDATTDENPSVAEAPQPVYPIPVEDPTDQRILKIVQAEPGLTDTDVGLRIGGMRRQNVNRRRKGLENMGYEVRSRYKRRN